MAEALISADHFYINGSQFNNTDVNQDAIISVQDSDDILQRSDDWLVHVTRFSCDSMVSLPYVETDSTAKWTVKIFGIDHAGLETFNFVLDRDYATPLDLINAMNYKSRFRPDAGGSYETYRFSIDAGGRFRRSLPESGPEYITYAATPSMNKLLGFDNVTSFLKFTPNYVHQYCNACDWLYVQAQNISTAANIFNGHYFDSMNKVLLRLLNGLEIQTWTRAGVEVDDANLPTMVAGFLDTINLLVGFVPNDRGRTPGPQATTNQALLTKGGPVLCEYFDITPNAHHNVDSGFKAFTSKMGWTNGQEYDDLGAQYGGLVHFTDLAAATSSIAVPCSNWPIRKPGTNGIFAHSRYVYPLDSVFGYSLSGHYTMEVAMAGGSSAVVGMNSSSWDANDPTSIRLIHPLISKVKVGDDMWYQDKFPYARGVNQLQPSLTSRGFSVHQVLAISEDRLTIRVDFPIGPLVQASTADPNWATGLDLLFTDRRVPFQSRSVSFNDIVHIWHEVYTDEEPHQAENTISHLQLKANQYTGAAIGDTLYWILDGALQAQGYPIVNVSGSSPNHIIAYTGRTPTSVLGFEHDTYGLFIHKRAADLARWAIDVENLKRAATTFSYHQIAYPRGSVVPAATVGRINYPARYQQTYDKANLHKQVQNAAKQARSDTLFDNVGSGDGLGITFEGVTEEVLSSIPETAEVVDMGTTTALDFGAHYLIPQGTPAAQQTGSTLGIYRQGTVMFERLPNPFVTVRAYIGQADINNFVKANPMARPWLHFLPGSYHSDITNTTTGYLTFRAAPAGTTNYNMISPLCLGIVAEPLFDLFANDAFIFWTPTDPIDNIVPIDMAAGYGQIFSPQAHVTVSYNSLSKPYILGRKELQSSTIAANEEVRLFSSDSDYIASTLISQVEHIFPFQKIILSSADLRQVPERSADAASRQPILTSYTLTTIIGTSIDSKGESAGGNSAPFGTIYFSETGARRFHHLIKVPGPLRQFKIEANITRKDPSKPETRVLLNPGGHFTCQLLFMKKASE